MRELCQKSINRVNTIPGPPIRRFFDIPQVDRVDRGQP